MHSQFSEWFRSAGMPQDDDVLQKRWAGVEAFEVDRDECVALIEVFFGNFDNKESFLDAFRTNFQDADSAFRMRDNNLELSILAGAALVDGIEGANSDQADFAALALVACTAQNLRRAPWVPEIPEIAAKYLARRTILRGKLEDSDIQGLDETQIEMKQMRRDLDLLGEETNILWWVFGETSRDSNMAWAKVGVNQTAIMAGKELSDLTKIFPGSSASSALLDHVLKCAKSKLPGQIVLKDVIKELPMAWRQQFLKNYYRPELATINPILSCIKLSVELAAEDAWENSFESANKVQKGGKLAPHLLAYQIFIESLTSRLWNEL